MRRNATEPAGEAYQADAPLEAGTAQAMHKCLTQEADADDADGVPIGHEFNGAVQCQARARPHRGCRAMT